MCVHAHMRDLSSGCPLTPVLMLQMLVSLLCSSPAPGDTSTGTWLRPVLTPVLFPELSRPHLFSSLVQKGVTLLARPLVSSGPPWPRLRDRPRVPWVTWPGTVRCGRPAVALADLPTAGNLSLGGLFPGHLPVTALCLLVFSQEVLRVVRLPPSSDPHPAQLHADCRSGRQADRPSPHLDPQCRSGTAFPSPACVSARIGEPRQPRRVPWVVISTRHFWM